LNNSNEETIVVIDYGVGNLGSVANMLKKVGAKKVIFSNDPEMIASSNKVLLPGVGSFDHGMKRLNDLGISDALKTLVARDDSLLMGICLGMQLLTEGSAEGEIPGLGLVPGKALLFHDNQGLKVPHMGWNVVYPKKSSFLLQDLPTESRFYFVHSYYVSCSNEEDVLCTTNYGNEFVSSFQRGNIIGCQFHPEKSHRFGMQLFKNFVNCKGIL
tara:strand:- start:9205 stop:9846 length:642 start_codon:yes stop_codon:yes gene_type:complete